MSTVGLNYDPVQYPCSKQYITWLSKKFNYWISFIYKLEKSYLRLADVKPSCTHLMCVIRILCLLSQPADQYLYRRQGGIYKTYLCSLSTWHCWNQASIRNCCFVVQWNRQKDLSGLNAFFVNVVNRFERKIAVFKLFEMIPVSQIELKSVNNFVVRSLSASFEIRRTYSSKIFFLKLQFYRKAS